jgi:hypothetical protein
LLCEKLDHLRITAIPQALLIGGTSTLRVTAEDVNNQEVVPESDFDVTFTLSSPDIYWGSVRDTTNPGGLLPGVPGILLKKSAGAREGTNPSLSRLQSWMFGSFTVDGGAAEPDQITVPYSVAKEARVKYVADGDMLSWFDSITVSIRVEKTADPNKFGTTDVMVKNVTCARVTFDPSKLAPGETAQLSFKKVLDDGTLEDFPADQVFDVMIVGGGGNAGTLQSASGSGPTLTGTLAPVRYVAPAALEGDSLIVQVAAFAYGSGGATLSVTEAKATPLLKKVPGQVTTQALSKKAQDSVMVVLGKLLASSECVPGEAVVVKQKGCIDAPPCGGVFPVAPGIEVVSREPGFANTYLDCRSNTLAEFRAVDDRPTEPISVSACSEGGVWYFNVSTIQINTILDFCQNNIAGKQLLNSVDDVPLISDKCCAKQDFEGHYEYPVGGTGRAHAYIIVPAIIAHEMKHKLDYQAIAFEKRGEIVDLVYSNLHPTCESYPTVQEAIDYAKGAMKSTLENIMMPAITEAWNTLTKAPDYEMNTQNNDALKSIIRQFIEALDLGPSDCTGTVICN